MTLLCLDAVAARLAEQHGLSVSTWSSEAIPEGDAVLLLSHASLPQLKGWRLAGVVAPAIVVGPMPVDTVDQRASLEPLAHVDVPDAAAVEALVARWQRRVEEARVAVGTGWVDVARRRLVTDEGVVDLTGLQVSLLAYLAARPGVLVPEEELLREVWQYAAGVRTRAVAMAVSRLRRLIETDPQRPVVLLNERGGGYKFVPPAGAGASHEAPGRGHDGPGGAPGVEGVVRLAARADALRAATFGPDVDAAREALVALEPELRHALAVTDASQEDRARVGLALATVMVLTAAPASRLRLIDRVLADTPQASAGVRARLWLARARAGVRVDLRAAAEDAWEGLRLAREAGDPELLAFALLRAVWHGARSMRPVEAMVHEVVALTEHDPMGAWGPMARIQLAIHEVKGDVDRFRAARGLLELTFDELMMQRRYRPALDLAGTVAGALHAAGDSKRAEAALASYRSVLTHWPDRVAVADILHHDAARAIEDGQPDEGLALFARMHDLLFADGGRPDGPFLYARAGALLDAGQHVLADRDLELAAAELSERIPTMAGSALSIAAMSRMEQGELPSAEALARRSYALASMTSNATREAARAVHAMVLQRIGRLQEAAAIWEDLDWSVLGVRHSLAFAVARFALARRTGKDAESWRIQVESLLASQADRAWGPLVLAAWPDPAMLRTLTDPTARPVIPVALRLAIADLVSTGARVAGAGLPSAASAVAGS